VKPIEAKNVIKSPDSAVAVIEPVAGNVRYRLICSLQTTGYFEW
jgi:hypothetical protein